MAVTLAIVEVRFGGGTHEHYLVALGPDGALYVGQIAACNNCNGVFRIAPELPGASADEIAYPSEDGQRIDYFTLGGRHLRTQDATTGVTLYSFEYDAAGRLVLIVDANEDSTRIHRNGSGSSRACAACSATAATASCWGWIS